MVEMVFGEHATELADGAGDEWGRRGHPVLAVKKEFMADGENSFSPAQHQVHDCEPKTKSYPLAETGQDSRELPISQNKNVQP
jgi:hypothetical protein